MHAKLSLSASIASAISTGAALVLMGLIAGASAQAPFHAAQSAAEKALDRLVHLADSDDNLFDFALKRPSYDPAKNRGYGRLFTKNLLVSWSRAEAKAVARDCGGRYRTGEICGLDYNPITCAQDSSESGYLYRTKVENDRAAVITYKWNGNPASDEVATYRMIRDGNDWKLDGVDCAVGAKFNMK